MTKGRQKRATEVCYSCKAIRLCLTHKMSISSKCDVPSFSVSVAAHVPELEPESVAEPVSASPAAAPGPIAEVLPLDYLVQCFFRVGTTTSSLAWTPKRPCLKKDPGSEECPGEAETPIGEEVLLAILAISKPIVLCVMFARARGVQKHLRGGCTEGCTKGSTRGVSAR